MPPRRRSTSGIRRAGARRKLVWATANGTVVLDGIATNVNVDLLANLRVAGSSVLGSTVMRTHMRWTLQWPDTGFIPQGMAVGLVVQSLQLVNTDSIDLLQDEDWAYRDRFSMGTGVNTLAGADVPIEGFTLDLRAKRKVQELNQTWALAMSYQDALAPGSNLEVTYFARTLIALA